MRKIILLLLVGLFITTIAFADGIITRSTNIGEIYLRGPTVSSNYWLKFINHNPTKDDSVEFYYERCNFDDFNADRYDILKLETLHYIRVYNTLF